MAGDKLIIEVEKYLGLPYFSNSGKHKTLGNNVFVGKGSAQEIALATINLANQARIKLVNLTSSQIYNFQKKHYLGIDCSGLACHLLNYCFGAHLDVRKTSANMLTSSPISQQIESIDTRAGDLIRQKNGRHVLIIISNNKKQITYIHSSRETHGVVLETKNITDIHNQGFFRLLLLN